MLDHWTAKCFLKRKSNVPVKFSTNLEQPRPHVGGHHLWTCPPRGPVGTIGEHRCRMQRVHDLPSAEVERASSRPSGVGTSLPCRPLTVAAATMEKNAERSGRENVGVRRRQRPHRLPRRESFLHVPRSVRHRSRSLQGRTDRVVDVLYVSLHPSPMS